MSDSGRLQSPSTKKLQYLLVDRITVGLNLGRTNVATKVDHKGKKKPSCSPLYLDVIAVDLVRSWKKKKKNQICVSLIFKSSLIELINCLRIHYLQHERVYVNKTHSTYKYFIIMYRPKETVNKLDTRECVWVCLTIHEPVQFIEEVDTDLWLQPVDQWGQTSNPTLSGWSGDAVHAFTRRWTQPRDYHKQPVFVDPCCWPPGGRTTGRTEEEEEGKKKTNKKKPRQYTDAHLSDETQQNRAIIQLWFTGPAGEIQFILNIICEKEMKCQILWLNNACTQSEQILLQIHKQREYMVLVANMFMYA